MGVFTGVRAEEDHFIGVDGRDYALGHAHDRSPDRSPLRPRFLPTGGIHSVASLFGSSATFRSSPVDLVVHHLVAPSSPLEAFRRVSDG